MPVSPLSSITTNIQNGINNLNISQKPLPPIPSINSEYENVSSYHNQNHLPPKRPAPKTPIMTTNVNVNANVNTNTMGAIHSEIEGVPFILNPDLSKETYQMPVFPHVPLSNTLDYNFQLERQILCTAKSGNTHSKNPFFH